MPMFRLAVAAALICAAPAVLAESVPAPPPTTADVIARSTPSDWRQPDPDNVLYLDLASGRVVIELAPQFAPAHVDNIRTLARQKYWDGLAIVRSQDNYVVQWGDPEAGSDKARSLGEAKAKLPAEFDNGELSRRVVPLREDDPYARQAGWVDGFPVGHDNTTSRTWLAHCYAAVGAGRDMAADSSTGAELYVVIGHAPRHLDRNITLVGRVLQGIELLSVLPRGKGALGFYETPAERVPIVSIKLASSVPESERVALEVFRTDTSAFTQLVESRRNRREEWFIDPVGKIELCNVPIPVRAVAPVTAAAKD